MARVASRADLEVPPHPGRIISQSPDHKSFQLSITLTNQRRKRRSPWSTPPGAVLKPQPHWLIADWVVLMESAGGESFPSGQRQGHAATGEDEFPSPDHNPTFSEPQCHWPRGRPRPPSANQGARDRGGSCPSGERPGPASPGEDKAPSPVTKSCHTSTNPTNRGRIRRFPESIPHRTM